MQLRRKPEGTPQSGDKIVFDDDVTIGDVVVFERDDSGLRIRALTESRCRSCHGSIYVLTAISADGQASFIPVGEDELAI